MTRPLAWLDDVAIIPHDFWDNFTSSEADLTFKSAIRAAYERRMLPAMDAKPLAGLASLPEALDVCTAK